MNHAPLGAEAARLESLASYGILDTAPERAYDDVAALAAQMCDAPMALITLVDADRQWVKARVGVDIAETPREHSFCAVAIQQHDPLIVENAATDARFAASPLVTGEPHIRFYAGVPLVADGHALGALCVLDRRPRTLSTGQRHALAVLGEQVVAHLTSRRVRLGAENAEKQWSAAEQALRESQEFQTRLIESSQDCIKVLDLDGRLLSMNEGGMRTMEICDFGPLCNAPWPSLWPEESRRMVADAIDAARSGGVGRFAGFCPTAAGSPRWWDVAVNAILGTDGRPERLLAVSRDITDRHRAEELLRAIVAGTASATGSAFFSSLVRHLADALGVWRVVFAECVSAGRVRARAVWLGDEFAQPFEYDVAGTPCAKVVCGVTSFYPSDVQRHFPDNHFLSRANVQSYLGVPLFSAERQVIGHLVVTDRKPMPTDPLWISVLETFAARGGAELERERADQRLRDAMNEVERLKNQLAAENVYLQEEIQREHNFEDMVGNSPALLGLLDKVQRVASTDATVLIHGDTGTGKELIARALHNSGPRRNRPLVKVNCGAIPSNLIESELFGHVKGAFTGAIDRRIGRIELADGGSLFLDEVGELPLDTQVKLLRVLQEREFEPLGSNRTISVDVRVIAASNRDLNEEVSAGRFRADLFFRLNVVPLSVPPLRDRREDIPLLVTYFASKFAKKFGRRIDGVTREAMSRLVHYSWPGNVRELQNVVERAVVLAHGSMLSLDDDALLITPATEPRRAPEAQKAEPAVRRTSAPAAGNLLSLSDAERRHIEDVLSQTGGVIEGPAGAARILQLHPNTLRSRMKKLGVVRQPNENQPRNMP